MNPFFFQTMHPKKIIFDGRHITDDELLSYLDNSDVDFEDFEDVGAQSDSLPNDNDDDEELIIPDENNDYFEDIIPLDVAFLNEDNPQGHVIENEEHPQENATDNEENQQVLENEGAENDHSHSDGDDDYQSPVRSRQKKRVRTSRGHGRGRSSFNSGSKREINFEHEEAPPRRRKNVRAR